MFKTKDISVVIPTYNRAEDLRVTLESIKKFSKNLKEIIIVDQSTNDATKNMLKSFKWSNLKYVFSKTPAITIARNLGVKNSKKSTKIICFLDDDVILDDNYFNKILEVFNEHPEAMGVAGYNPLPADFIISRVEETLKKLFFLGHIENKEQARMISAYGNTYPASLSKVIHTQWLPGVNMAYRKEIFKDQQFDENLLGYTVAEDIDFSYRLWKRYNYGVFITPFAKVVHRVSLVEREPTIRISYINQIDHWYFQGKNMHSLGQKLIFLWSLFGIGILRSLKMIFSMKKNDYLKWKYYFISLAYCFSHRWEIKQGKLRLFKNHT